MFMHVQLIEFSKMKKNSKNVRVKTRIFFGRQRTDLGTRDSGQKSKFIDKTPQGPRSIQLRNRFAVLGELDEEQIHDYCVSKQIDINNQGSKIGYKSEEKQLSYSHDHVTGERDFSNIHCESVFCKKPQVWPSYDTRDENLSRNFISTQNTGYPTHSEGVHSALHQENQLFGDKHCNNCEIKNLEYEHVLWPDCDSRDKNLSKDFICIQNTCYPTHSEGVNSTSSQLTRSFGDKYHNNVGNSKPECDHMYTQCHNIENERRLNVEPIQSSDQVDGKSTLSSRNNDLQGHRCHSDLSNATCLNNSHSIVEATLVGKVCVKRVNVHHIVDKSENLKLCLQQQDNAVGFLPINNLSYRGTNLSLAPKVIISDPKFDPVKIHRLVRNTGRYNFEEERIFLPSKINFPLFESLAQGYWDWQLPFFVKYGFPLDFPYAKEADLKSGEGNHASANKFPVHVDSYLDTEINHGAIAGPYDSPPYGNDTHISPFMSRPKDDSDNRRIIIDLSWPLQGSINTFTPTPPTPTPPEYLHENYLQAPISYSRQYHRKIKEFG